MVHDKCGHEKSKLAKDVFTGILAEKLGIPRRLAMELRNNAERVLNHFLGCTLLRSISLHKIYADEQEELLIGFKTPTCGP